MRSISHQWLWVDLELTVADWGVKMTGWWFVCDWARMVRQNSLPKSRRGIVVQGAYLKQLREQLGLTQEDAALRACVSVKVIQKAERGLPLSPESIRRLAAAYSLPGSPLSPTDLITEVKQPEVILVRFIEGIWSNGWRQVVDRLVDDSVTFRCELGTLHGRAALTQRLESLHRMFAPVKVMIEDQTGDDQKAACRWRLQFARDVNDRLTSLRHGMTSIVVKDGKIVEAAEYWEPDTRAPLVAS